MAAMPLNSTAVLIQTSSAAMLFVLLPPRLPVCMGAEVSGLAAFAPVQKEVELEGCKQEQPHSAGGNSMC